MNKQNAKKLLLEIKSVLDDLNIEFFLTHGTALGAFRGGDFISYDRDIDLGIKEEIYKPNAEKIREEFLKQGFEVFGFFAPRELIRAMKVQKYGIHCDIVGYRRLDDEVFVISNIREVCYVFSAKLFKNLETINFCGTKFKIPSPVVEYMKALYGEKWKIPIKSRWETPCVIPEYRKKKNLLPSYEETRRN